MLRTDNYVYTNVTLLFILEIFHVVVILAAVLESDFDQKTQKCIVVSNEAAAVPSKYFICTYVASAANTDVTRQYTTFMLSFLVLNIVVSSAFDFLQLNKHFKDLQSQTFGCDS